MYVDGGIGNPYPIDIVDDNKTKVLGVYIETRINYDPESGILKYLQGLVGGLMYKIREYNMQKSSAKCKHLNLINNTKNNPMNIGIGLTTSKDEKYQMIVSGFRSTMAYFENLTKDDYVLSKDVESDISTMVNKLDRSSLYVLIKMANDRIVSSRELERPPLTELHILNMNPEDQNRLFENGKSRQI
jgi:hypothetical protein